MSLRELKRNLKRLKRLGWKWREIGEVCDRSEGWACAVARGKQIPPEPSIEEALPKLEEAMRDLPRELWETTEELRTSILAEIRENHIGIKNAIKIRYLARILGTTDRMVRSAVNHLRKQGYPICTSVGNPAGLYWPRTMKEYKEFKYRDYLSRMKDMQEVVDAMDMGAERLFAGQRIEMQLQPELISS